MLEPFKNEIGIASGVNHKCLLGDGIAKDGAVALERANRKGFDQRLGNCGLSHVGFRLQADLRLAPRPRRAPGGGALAMTCWQADSSKVSGSVPLGIL